MAVSTAQATGTVDIMIPVYNEERALPGCVEVLHGFLEEQFPFDWSIVVVDNASTDGTLAVAEDLAKRYERVRVHHLDRKGRGLALRESWGSSEAAVVVYMDVDLSTGLDGLLPLVAPLLNGHSDLAIGSRLAPGSRLAGPAIVEEPAATVVLHPGDQAEVTPYGALIVRCGGIS